MFDFQIEAEVNAIKAVAEGLCPLRISLDRVVLTSTGVLLGCWQVFFFPLNPHPPSLSHTPTQCTQLFDSKLSAGLRTHCFMLYCLLETKTFKATFPEYDFVLFPCLLLQLRCWFTERSSSSVYNLDIFIFLNDTCWSFHRSPISLILVYAK
mgnify:CR=1 FL=1